MRSIRSLPTIEVIENALCDTGGTIITRGVHAVCMDAVNDPLVIAFPVNIDGTAAHAPERIAGIIEAVRVD